jgi:hypothetical protein
MDDVIQLSHFLVTIVLQHFANNRDICELYDIMTPSLGEALFLLRPRVARHLVGYYESTRYYDKMDEDSCPFEEICTAVCFRFAKWFSKEYHDHLGKQHAIVTLNSCCENGLDEICMWLVETFNMKTQDLSYDYIAVSGNSLMSSIETNNLKMVKYFVDKFPDITEHKFAINPVRDWYEKCIKTTCSETTKQMLELVNPLLKITSQSSVSVT